MKLSLRTYGFLLLCLILQMQACFTVQAQKKDTLQGGFYNKSIGPSWIRELKNVIVVSPKNDTEADTFNIQSPNNSFLGMEGRTIVRIRIVRLSPFGGDVINDTVNYKLSWLGEVGNAIHAKTREFVIRQSLLFREGDKVNSFKLADTERFLRSLRYIDDARIIATALPNDEAEIVVVTQDVLPYAVTFGTNFASRANLALSNRNIIGLGYELRAGAFIDSDKDHLWGWESKFRIPNISRTFISLELDFLDKYETKRFGIILNRDFYAPSTKYAGNITIHNSLFDVNYRIPGESIAQLRLEPIRLNYFDVWFGRSFRLNKTSINKQRENITLSTRAQQTHFLKRPDKAQEYYYQFQNRTVFLTSLTLSKQAYYKTNLIYNFGRTEDIPYGRMASIVVGREYNEQYNRNYLGGNISGGYFLPNIGYLSGAVTYGTFFDHGPKQGTLDFHLDYFTNLYVIGNFKQRSFINFQYTQQLDTHLNDYLNIDGEVGIPGFRNDSIKGRSRFNLTLEQNLFAPWNVSGFRFVLFAFSNFSWIGGHETADASQDMYMAFGLGCRIRNNRLILSTLQIRLAYFHNLPPNSKFRYIHFSKETLLEPRNFAPKAPEIVPLY